MMALSECAIGAYTILWIVGAAKALHFIRCGNRIEVIANSGGGVIVKCLDGRKYAVSSDIAGLVKVNRQEVGA
ncbi:MAG: hypothetical protein LUE86_08810 [Clostridiales bacterium]|nr:hypothetical protein [Clostridiales bacterium]